MQSLNATAYSLSLSQTSPNIRFGDKEPGFLTHRHRNFLTEKGIRSLCYYYEVGTSGNALLCHIISAGLSLLYFEISLYNSVYQTAVRIVSPVESAYAVFHLQ